MPEQEHKNLPKGKDGLEEAPKDKDESLHTRIAQAVAGTHPTSRDVEVKDVHQVAPGLHVAHVTHTPAAGVQAHDRALVYDDGEKSSLLWFR